VRPSSTARSMVEKLSSARTISAAFLGRPRCPSIAHRHADVGALERGGVVDAVAGHRHHLAARLQRGDQAQLVLGAGAGKDVAVLGELLQFLVRGGLDLGARHHAQRLGRAEAHLDADRARGAGVVAGDHLHADAGGVAGADGVDGLRARRVDDADEAEEDHVLLEILERERLLVVRDLARGRGEHAQAFGAQGLDLLLPEAALERLEPAAGAELARAPVEQAVGRTLQQDAAGAAGRSVERGHELVGRLERDAGVALSGRRRRSRPCARGCAARLRWARR